MGGLLDLPWLSGFIVMRVAQHDIYIVPLSVCGQPCNWIRRTTLSGGAKLCSVATVQLGSANVPPLDGW